VAAVSGKYVESTNAPVDDKQPEMRRQGEKETRTEGILTVRLRNLPFVVMLSTGNVGRI